MTPAIVVGSNRRVALPGECTKTGARIRRTARLSRKGPGEQASQRFLEHRQASTDDAGVRFYRRPDGGVEGAVGLIIALR